MNGCEHCDFTTIEPEADGLYCHICSYDVVGGIRYDFKEVFEVETVG